MVKFTENKLDKLSDLMNDLYEKVGNILATYENTYYNIIKGLKANGNPNGFYVESRLSKYKFKCDDFVLSGFGDGERVWKYVIVTLKQNDAETEDEVFEIPVEFLRKENDQIKQIVESQLLEETSEILERVEENQRKREEEKVNELLSKLEGRDKEKVKELLSQAGVI